MSEIVGREFAGFRVTQELAEGGMGIVFRGERQEDRTPVAIKILHERFSNDRNEMARFIREAVIYKRLVHPNLLRFHKFGFEGNVGFYLVTEFLEGEELGERLAMMGPGKAMDLKVALDTALQISAGLAAAHEEGIVHRDLKPANIFLAKQEDGSEVAKIFDFGIGKMLEQEFQHKLTITGESLGTPLYMAPEQIRDPENVGTWTDLYAFGVMLFQMLTGWLPFSGNSAMDILREHLTKPAPLLRKHNRFLAGTELEALVDALLTKEWMDRPSSVKQVKERLWESKQMLAPESLGATMAMPQFDISLLLGSQSAIDSANSGSTDTHEEIKAVPDPAETERPAAVLLLQTQEGEEEVGWLLPGERLQIGSSQKADVRLRSRSVAPQHAEVYCAPQRWVTVECIDSSVVRVNGASISSSMLQDGDSITLGGAELRIHFFA